MRETMRDATLKKIVTDFRKGILDGKPSAWMCAVVCRPLQGYLSAVCEVETQLVDGHLINGECEIGHCWLKLPDGRIIDPTADQFSSTERPMPPVYIGKLPEWYRVEEVQI